MVVVMAVVALAACTDASGEVSSAPDPVTSGSHGPGSPLADPSFVEQPSITNTVIIGSARLPTMFGRSVEDMVGAYDDAAIITVLGYEDLSHSLEYAPDDSIFDDPDSEERIGRGDPGYVPSLARFTIRVDSVIYGAVHLHDEEGGLAYLLQGGGYVESTEYIIEDEPLVEIGKSYFVFLGQGPSVETYSSLSFGRYELAEGVLSTDTPFAGLGVVVDLVGRPVDEAIDRVSGIARDRGAY